MLAVTGGKGGVGKTTTALGLGVAAARAGDRPVVVDADRDCPDLATMAGTDGRGLARLADGASVAVAGTRVRGVTVLGARFDDERVVAPALDRLSDADRPVVVDCPAGAGAPVATPLRAADRSLVVVRRTERALVDGRTAATLARRLGADPVGVVVSRAGTPGRAGAVFEAPVVGTVPTTETAPAWTVGAPHVAIYSSLDCQNA